MIDHRLDILAITLQGIQRIICEKIEREETLNTSAIRGMLSSMMRDVFPSMILSSLCQMVREKRIVCRISLIAQNVVLYYSRRNSVIPFIFLTFKTRVTHVTAHCDYLSSQTLFLPLHRSLAQVAFALGSLSFMPSVQNFAYNATIALLMNFILQTTVFLILIRVDLMRQLNGRYNY